MKSIEDGKIQELIKKHKFLKGFSKKELFEMFLSRCECCDEICFTQDLIPTVNYKGDTYKVCENCNKDILEKSFIKDDNDKYYQYLEDKQEIEW